MLAVGAESAASELASIVGGRIPGFPLEAEDFFARLDGPHFHRAISRAAGEPVAVGAEGHTPGRPIPLRERANFLTRLRVPDADTHVLGTTGQAFPLRTESPTTDPAGLSLDGKDFPARMRVPQLDFTLETLPLLIPQHAAASQATAIRAKRHPKDSAGMSPEDKDFPARRQV